MRRPLGLRLTTAASIILCAGLALAGPALAQGTDPADLVFWQSIQNSTNPAEYQAYLDAFPQGKFAPLARLRVQGGAMPAGATPTPAPAPMPQAAMPAPAPAMPAAAPAQPGLNPPIAVDTAKNYGQGRFHFEMEKQLVSIGAKPVLKFRFPPDVKTSIIIMRAGANVPNWRYSSPDIVAREDIHNFEHDPDPSGPNRYLETGTLEFQPLPMGDYWIRLYTNQITGADTMIGTVAFRVY